MGAILKAIFFLIAGFSALYGQEEIKKKETVKTSEEAYIYGYPMLVNYQNIYNYFINNKSSDYKGPFNTITHQTKSFSPQDAVSLANNDLLSSYLFMDLRAEPMILCAPDVEKNRYYNIQLLSLNAFNLGYIGTRATGNEAGCFAIIGPSWKNPLPTGVKKAFYSETDFAIALFHTQLFDASDIANVEKVQNGYKALPLSKFLEQLPTKSDIPLVWPEIDQKKMNDHPFVLLSFLMQFSPVSQGSEEQTLRTQFEDIGLEAGAPFPTVAMNNLEKNALNSGIKNGIDQIKQTAANLGTKVNGWNMFLETASSEFKKASQLKRAAFAMTDIYYNDPKEVIELSTNEDDENQLLDGKNHNYKLTFAAAELPPVNSFWSITIYQNKDKRLVENPLQRYSVNAYMIPKLKKNANGSVSIYIQNESPGKDYESNWLPAPSGPIYLVMRLYGPKEDLEKKTWEPPAVKKIK